MQNTRELSASAPLKVLIVDDERTNRLVLEAMLRKMGHESILANNGKDGIEMVLQQRPDMVLMDVMMPEMSGYDAVRALRKLPEGQLPIIFLTALSKAEDIIEGLNAGGDDYLHKPIHYDLLKSKIRMVYERRWLLANLADQNQLLLDYKDRLDQDRKTAVRFADRLSARDHINDPSVKFFLKHAEDFGGDLVAAARTPDGQIHALLTDSAGHGLAAALSIFPLVGPFYMMTSKGLNIQAIIAELNKRVKEFTSLPNYVTATIVAVNPREGVIEVWNGGSPDALLLAEGKGVIRRFSSLHLPLGILSKDKFDDSVERFDFARMKCKLFLYSDGLTELNERDGIALDLESVFNQYKFNTEGFENVVQMISASVGTQQITDDIALLGIDVCKDREVDEFQTQHEPPSNEKISSGDIADAHPDVAWQFDVTLTAAQLKHLDVVPMLVNIAGTIEMDGTDAGVFMVLSELFNNALDHGVLKLDSSLKHQDDGMEGYYETRALRLAALQDASIRICISHLDSVQGHWLKLSVQDSGDGFDFEAYRHRAVESVETMQRHGRGLKLVFSMCDLVEFSDEGSNVVAYLPWTSS
jgi:CheY-like chemotaxis protein